MCVALDSDVAVTSFYSTIAEKISSQNEDFDEIFNVRFKPECVVEFARILKRYDDVTRCFTKESLDRLFREKWRTIFEFDNEGYVSLRKKDLPKNDSDDYARRIVLYLLRQMRPQLNNYPPGFLRKAGIK